MILSSLENIPDLEIIINEIKSKIKWENGIPFPQRNFDLEFDKLCDEMSSIEIELS